MKIDCVKNIVAADLRVIILALKLEEFNIEDEQVKNDVYDRIKRLPSAESINVLASNDNVMHNLRSQVGQILEIVDKHDKRDMDYKVRYKARTGLAPRHKVLEWRRSAQVKNDIIKNIVCISSDADKEGFVTLSKDLLDCAKRLSKNEDIFEKFSNTVIKFAKNTTKDPRGLLKEAQHAAEMDFSMEDIQQGTQNIKAWIDYMMQSITKLYQFKGKAGAKPLMDRLEKVWTSLSKLKGSVEPQLDKVNEESLAIGTDMGEQLTAKSVTVRDAQGNPQVVAIEYKPDPDNPEWQVAVITHPKDGKQYVVNKDETTGKLGLGREYGAAQALPAERPIEEATPEATAPTPETESLNQNTPAQTGATETSSFEPGQTVTWESAKSGNTQTATVVGPAPALKDGTPMVLVQFPNGSKMPIKEPALRSACERYRLKKQS